MTLLSKRESEMITTGKIIPKWAISLARHAMRGEELVVRQLARAVCHVK